jgi:hypothetical protein
MGAGFVIILQQSIPTLLRKEKTLSKWLQFTSFSKHLEKMSAVLNIQHMLHLQTGYDTYIL